MLVILVLTSLSLLRERTDMEDLVLDIYFERLGELGGNVDLAIYA